MKFRSLLTVLSLATIIGCQSDRVMETSPNRDIPRKAIYAKEGAGRLWFQSSDDGVAYIYDADTTQLVFATAMTKDQRLVIDPQRGRATVEGKPVFEQPLARNHTHRVYFEPHGKLPPPPKEPAPIELKPSAPTTAPTS